MLAWREILEWSATATVVGDPSTGRCIWANQAARELFGLSLDEFRARTGRQLHPEEFRQTIDAVSGDLDHRRRVHLPQIRICTASGRECWVEFHVHRVEPGPVWVASYRDVTREVDEQRHLERLGRLTTLGRLAAGVAHEINNPATYALANLEALRSSLSEIPTDAQRRADLEELLGDTAEGVERMVRVARQLKDLASDTAQMDGPVSVSGVLDEAARLTRKYVETKGRLLVQHSDLGETHGDHGRLVQALVNLLMNAVDAIDQGGTVRLEGRRLGESVFLRVIDDGHGMSQEVARRAAEPFYTEGRSGRNPGLGLSVTWRIVEDHGGQVLIASEHGSGTTVTVELPVRAAAADPDSTAIPGPVVLIVDDEPALLRAAARVLGRHYTVLTAQDGPSALELSRGADLILLDVVMPGMDGVAVYAALPPEKQACVLLMSGGALDARGRAFASSHTLVEKPFNPSTLLEAVAERLRMLDEISS